MDECIKLVDVSKWYRKTEVVKSLSLSVPKECLCAILGANGAGKTTTMNMIITLLAKNQGKIYVDGLDIDTQKEIIRQRIGVVFQEDFLDPELTVYENLYYRGGLYLPHKKDLQERIQTISELLSIGPLLKKRYKTCSGGQKRLVQIGRALLSNPKLLVLDEPTIGLDPFAREQVWLILRKLNRENGITIFYSTHYMEEASYAQQVCIIHEGNLLLCQKTSEFDKKPSEFISSQLHQRYLQQLRDYEAQKGINKEEWVGRCV